MTDADNLTRGYEFLGQVLFWGFILFMFACPICSAIVASAKGRDAVSWFFLGLLFGPFGLLAVVGCPPIDREAQLAYAGRRSKKAICPACHEPMWAGATTCPHCQTLIDDEPV